MAQSVNTSASSPKPAVAQTDGAIHDNESVSSYSSGTGTPSPLYDGRDDRVSPAVSPFVSRSGSPAPITGQDVGRRAASPVQFGYPYNYRDGYRSNSQTPTAMV